MNRPRVAISSTLAMALMLFAGCQASQAAQTVQSDQTTQTASAPNTQNAAQIKVESTPPSKPQSAKALGWELIYHDTFGRKDLGENWKAIDGKWAIVGGLLHGDGTLISTQGYPANGPAGYQRLEFEAVSNIRGLDLFPGSKPKVVASDMDAFIHVQSLKAAGKNPMMTGYFFQFGGNYNTANRIRQQHEILWEDQESKATIVTEKWHHVVVENDKGTLRFYVDENLLHEQKLTSIVMGDSQNHVGLYFLTTVKIRDVKVYVKRLPNDLDVE